MKKYRTDWRIGLVFLIALVIWVFSARSQAVNAQVFVNASLGMTILLVVVVLLITVLSYACIKGTTLKFIYLFFYRRTIDIHSITEINDQPTYKAAKSMFRSLYIFYGEKSNTKWIELKITVFSEKTLGKLIKELKRINPHIELNKYSQKLMDSIS